MYTLSLSPNSWHADIKSVVPIRASKIYLFLWFLLRYLEDIYSTLVFIVLCFTLCAAITSESCKAHTKAIQEQTAPALRWGRNYDVGYCGLPNAVTVRSSQAENCPPRMSGVIIPLLICGWNNHACNCWPDISKGDNTLVEGEDALSRQIRWTLSNELFKFCITNGAV